MFRILRRLISWRSCVVYLLKNDECRFFRYMTICAERERESKYRKREKVVNMLYVIGNEEKEAEKWGEEAS